MSKFDLIEVQTICVTLQAAEEMMVSPTLGHTNILPRISISMRHYAWIPAWKRKIRVVHSLRRTHRLHFLRMHRVLPQLFCCQASCWTTSLRMQRCRAQTFRPAHRKATRAFPSLRRYPRSFRFKISFLHGRRSQLLYHPIF